MHCWHRPGLPLGLGGFSWLHHQLSSRPAVCTAPFPHAGPSATTAGITRGMRVAGVLSPLHAERHNKVKDSCALGPISNSLWRFAALLVCSFWQVESGFNC